MQASNALQASTVLQCLSASLQSQHIAQATELLASFEKHEEYWRILLSVVKERSTVELAVRQAAILQFKNSALDKYWRRSASNAISSASKVQLRTCLLELLNEEIGKTLEICVGKIARWDYDSEWATLPDELLQIMRQSLETEPILLKRTLGACAQTLKALLANRMPKGRMLTQKISQLMFNDLSAIYNHFFTRWRADPASSEAGACLEKAALAFKSLRVALVYGWSDPSASPEVVTLYLSTCKHFAALRRHRASHLGGTDAMILTRLLLAYPKLWRALLGHNSQAALNMGLSTDLVGVCLSVVQEASPDPSATIDGDRLALFPEILMAGVLNILKLTLVDWSSDLAHDSAKHIVIELAQLLLSRLLVLRRQELEQWESDPEEWANISEIELNDLELRPCMVALLKALSGRYSEVVDLLKGTMAQTLDQNGDILAKEAVYGAIGHCSVHLTDAIDLESWLRDHLVAEAHAQTPYSRILRYRIARMLGDLAGDDTSAAARRSAYTVLVNLLADEPSSDLAVRLAAAQALSTSIGNSWHFEEQDFLPLLDRAMRQLLALLADCALPDSQLRVNSAIATLVERLSDHIRPYAESLIQALIPVWETAGDNHLLRVAVMTTMTRLVEALGESSPALHEIVASIVSLACDFGQHLFLLEDGVDLWLATLQQAATLTSPMYRLLPMTLSLIAAGTDTLPKALTVFECYCLLDGAATMANHAQTLLATVGSLLPGLKAEATRTLLHTTALATAQCSSSIWAPALDSSDCLLQLVIPLQQEDTTALIACRLLTLLARLIIIDATAFLGVLERTASRHHVLPSTLLDLLVVQWLDKLDNYQVGQRKLVALALAMLIGQGVPNALAQLAGICSFWLVPLSETAENGSGDSVVYKTDAAEAAGVGEDSTALGAVVGDDSPDRRRRVQLMERDPVHAMALRIVIQQQMAIAQSALGSAMQAVFLKEVDVLVLDELQRRIAGRLSDMSKSKNSSQHNQSRKAHKNGIFRPQKHRYVNRNGIDPKFKRNARHAAAGTQKALTAKRKGTSTS